MTFHPALRFVQSTLPFVTILSITSLAAPALATAGDQKGNGGGGVVCRNPQGQITSVTTLDVYEAQFRRIPLDFGSDQSEPMIIVDHVLDRLATIDAPGSERYRKLAHRFFDEDLSRFVSGITLPFTEDTGPVAPPVGCNIEQIVFQLRPSVPEDRLFTINKDLFDKLDAPNKAALILHEVIYEELSALTNHRRERLHTNSFYVRYYNEKILGKTMMTGAEYILLFSKHPISKEDCYMNKTSHEVASEYGVLDLCRSEAIVIAREPRLATIYAAIEKPFIFNFGNFSVGLRTENRGFPDETSMLKLSYNKEGALHSVAGSLRGNTVAEDQVPILKWPTNATKILKNQAGYLSAEYSLIIDQNGNFNQFCARNTNFSRISQTLSGTTLHFVSDAEYICLQLNTEGELISATGGRQVLVENKNTGNYFNTDFSSLKSFVPSADKKLISVQVGDGIYKYRHNNDWPGIAIESEFTLFTSLNLAAGTLAKDTTLKTTTGKEYLFKKGTKLEFNEEGHVTKWVLP